MRKRKLLALLISGPLLLSASSCGSKKNSTSSTGPVVGWQLDADTKKFIETFAYDFDIGPDGIKSNITIENMPSTDDEIIITGVLKPAAELTVPETVRGLKVTTIKDKAFASRSLNSQLEKINLPGSIKSLGNRVFYKDTKLKEVNFASLDNLVYVGDEAFGELEVTGQGSSAKFTSTTPYYQKILDSTTTTYLGNILLKAPSSSSGTFEVKDGTTCIISNALSHLDITSVKLPDTLKYIGAEAMSKTKLQSIVVPDSVVSIGDYAFYNNTEMTSAYLPNNSEFTYSSDTSYFLGNDNIKEFGFDGNAEIKNLFGGSRGFTQEFEKIVITPNANGDVIPNALKGVTGLKTLELKASPTGDKEVLVIRDSALPEDLSSLTEFICSENFEYLGDSDIFNSPYYNSLPDGLVVLGKNLLSVKGTVDPKTPLPSDLRGVSKDAVQNKLQVTSFPSGLRYVGSNAFKGNTTLTEVSMAEILSIGAEAFADCTNITSITLNLSCELGSGVFLNDTNVKSIDFNPSRALSDLFGENLPAIEHITLSEGVTDIKPSGFEGLSTLKTVTFPSTLKTIGKNAFKNCKLLEKVVIPESVSEIDSWAFAYCDSLTSVTFEKTTKTHRDQFAKDIIRPDVYLSIGNFAFAFDKKLTGEFVIVNRTISVGGAICFGTGVTNFRIEIDRNYLQDLSYSRFNPLNEANDTKYQNSWNLTDTKDKWGNQEKIGFKAYQVNFELAE
ncbi:MAG TPA: hypothetical protein DCY93_02390 [Firmicutes bacterium]|nr:hypothetical protein [Bacillota bacterium]